MIDKYDKYNSRISSRKYIEKLAKSILLLFNHIIKEENIDIKIKHNSWWKSENEYYINFYKDDITLSNIFHITFDTKDSKFDEYGPYIQIAIENGSNITDMIKCEKFLLFIKKIISPFDYSGQNYLFSNSFDIDSIPY